MHLFNRIVIVIVLLALGLTALAALFAPVQSVATVRGWLVSLEDAVPFRNFRSGAYWAYLGIVIGIIAICGVLLWLELRKARHTTVLVSESAGRRTEVTVKSITKRLQTALGSVADVTRVRPAVTSHGKKVDVSISLQVHQAIDPAMKSEEVIQVARQVVQDEMGVKVGRVRVDIEDRRPAARELPEPEITAPAQIAEPEPVEAETTAESTALAEVDEAAAAEPTSDVQQDSSEQQGQA